MINPLPVLSGGHDRSDGPAAWATRITLPPDTAIFSCRRAISREAAWPHFLCYAKVDTLNSSRGLGVELAVEPQSTKGRVLRACLQLFNERGVGNVTTAEIAATVGINQGNLYYYFKRKEQIVV